MFPFFLIHTCFLFIKKKKEKISNGTKMGGVFEVVGDITAMQCINSW